MSGFCLRLFQDTTWEVLIVCLVGEMFISLQVVILPLDEKKR